MKNILIVSLVFYVLSSGFALSQSCCDGHGGLGCGDFQCETVVCNQDNWCCTNSWDGICAGIAETDANNGGPCSGTFGCPISGGGSCIHTASFGTDNLPNDGTGASNFGVWAGDYTIFNDVIAGETYEFSSDIASDWLVLTDAGNTVLDEGTGTITWTATFSGTVRVHVSVNNNCLTQNTGREINAVCTSCTGGGPCVYTTPFGTASAPTDGIPVQISGCVFTGEYNVINDVVAGETYEFSSDIVTDWLVLTDVGNTVLDDGTGTITWTATFSGTVRLHVSSDDDCGQAGGCRVTTVTCTSCASCPPETIIASCGTAQSASGDGAGLWDITSCGGGTPGEESLFTFTAPQDGTYLLDITAINPGTSGGGGTGPYCDEAQTTPGFPSDPGCEASVCAADPWCCNTEWDGLCAGDAATDPNCTGCLESTGGGGAPGQLAIFWKPVSDGCNDQNWNCFGATDATGTYLGNDNFCFDEGEEYYIMIAPNHTNNYSIDFSIECPITPNISAPTVDICEGGTVNMTGSIHDVFEDGGEYYGYYWLLSDDGGANWFYQNVPDNMPGSIPVADSYDNPQPNSINLTFNPGDAGNYLIERDHFDACGVLQTSNTLSITVDEQSTPPTSVKGGGTFCLGTEVTLTRNGGSLGGGAQWEWFEGACGSAVIGTGNSITVTPNTTTTYYVRASASGNCNATGCTSTTVTVPGPSNQLSVNGSSATCVVDQNDFVHFLDNSGRLIASINSQGQNLGNVTATSYVEGTPLLVNDCASTIQTSVMDRHWLIQPDNPNPGGPVIVRLPFTNAELNSLITESNNNANPYDDVVGPGNVFLSKYSGPSNLDDDFDNNCPANGGDGNIQLHTPLLSGLVENTPNFGAHAATDRYIEYSIPSFSEFWLHGSDEFSPLPVTFTDFSTDCKDDYVEINWATSSEQNSSHYILERSFDGDTWREVYRTDGAGNSNSNISYSFKDERIGGVVYYRLTQYDIDGVYEELSPISSNCELDELDAKIYPNPTDEILNVELSSSEISFSETSISFVDVQGRIVPVDIIERNDHAMKVNVSQLEKGVYSVQILDTKSGKRIVKKFTVHK